MYGLLLWVDHAVTPRRTYTMQQNGDGTITLTPAGKVIQQGTNLAAVNFNNMEQGILAANISAAEAMRMLRLLQDKTTALEGLVIEQTLKNNQKYPFNDSKATVALGAGNDRNNKDYTVIVEAEPTDGFVGDIVVTDKLTNGFKVAYTGSAKSVKIKCYVQGGR